MNRIWVMVLKKKKKKGCLQNQLNLDTSSFVWTRIYGFLLCENVQGIILYSYLCFIYTQNLLTSCNHELRNYI